MAEEDMSHEELRAFLLDAKRHTYAGQGDDASVPPFLPGTRQLEHSAGPWLYRDIYAGMAAFVGQEIVYYQSLPIWSMVYSGGVVETSQPQAAPRAVYPFLQAALRRVSSEHPYRGPARYAEGSSSYACRVEGSLADFEGDETIMAEGLVVYRLRFSGGLLR